MLPFNSPEKLDKSLIKLLPDKEDINSYRQYGWFVSKKILPDSLIDNTLESIKRYRNGERDAVLPEFATQMDWTPDSNNIIQVFGYLSLQMKAIRDLVCFPLLAAIAGSLATTNQIRLFHDRLIIKPGGLATNLTETGWHTDKAYWFTATSNKLLTAWIPLADSTIDTGTLAVVDGSHLWEPVCDKRRFFTPDIGGALPDELLLNNQESNIRIVELKRGQVLYHHCRILHRSVPNKKKETRYALAVHMQDQENMCRLQKQANGKIAVHSNDLICKRDKDGLPDYSDPNVFPILWQSV